MSSQMLEWRHTWKKYNPDYEFILWNDEKINKLELIRHDMIKYCNNFSETSDLLRFEILYKFGGLYIDTDFECLKPINPLIENKTFVVFREKERHVCGAFLASSPQNKYIKMLLDNLDARKNIVNSAVKWGPVYLDMMLSKDENASELINEKTKTVYPYQYDEKHRANEDFSKDPEVYAVHRWHGSWTT